VLISAQLVRGRQVTGVHSIADDIRNAGGLYRDQPTVTDSNWVSTRGAEDLPQFNRAMLEKLASAIPAQPVTSEPARLLNRVEARERLAILAKREECHDNAEGELCEERIRDDGERIRPAHNCARQQNVECSRRAAAGGRRKSG
jgi:hypothetical protein